MVPADCPTVIIIRNLSKKKGTPLEGTSSSSGDSPSSSPTSTSCSSTGSDPLRRPFTVQLAFSSAMAAAVRVVTLLALHIPPLLLHADAAAAAVVSSPGGGSNVFWLEDPAKSISAPSQCGDGDDGGAAACSFTATNEEGRLIATGTTKNGGIDMSDR